MVTPEQYQWEQGSNGQQIDIRFTCTPDKITLHPLKGGEDQDFDSIDEATDFMAGLFEQGTQAQS